MYVFSLLCSLAYAAMPDTQPPADAFVQRRARATEQAPEDPEIYLDKLSGVFAELTGDGQFRPGMTPGELRSWAAKNPGKIDELKTTPALLQRLVARTDFRPVEGGGDQEVLGLAQDVATLRIAAIRIQAATGEELGPTINGLSVVLQNMIHQMTGVGARFMQGENDLVPVLGRSGDRRATLSALVARHLSGAMDTWRHRQSSGQMLAFADTADAWFEEAQGHGTDPDRRARLQASRIILRQRLAGTLQDVFVGDGGEGSLMSQARQQRLLVLNAAESLTRMYKRHRKNEVIRDLFEMVAVQAVSQILMDNLQMGNLQTNAPGTMHAARLLAVQQERLLGEFTTDTSSELHILRLTYDARHAPAQAPGWLQAWLMPGRTLAQPKKGELRSAVEKNLHSRSRYALCNYFLVEPGIVNTVGDEALISKYSMEAGCIF